MDIKCYIITHKGRPCRKGSYGAMDYSLSPTVYFSKDAAEKAKLTRSSEPSEPYSIYKGRGNVPNLVVKEATLTILE